MGASRSWHRVWIFLDTRTLLTLIYVRLPCRRVVFSRIFGPMRNPSHLIPGTLLTGTVLLYGLLTLIGIDWGLPSSARDSYLFSDGTEAVWSGDDIARLSKGKARTDPHTGADVDINPLTNRSEPYVLNDNAAAQAEIYRRYRLFTYQPDEMITMMANPESATTARTAKATDVA